MFTCILPYIQLTLPIHFDSVRHMNNLSISSIIFPQDSNVLIVHLIGAFLLFVMGTAYCVTHTIISYKLYPQYNTMLLCRLRLVITTTTAVSMIISILFDNMKPEITKEKLRERMNVVSTL